MRQSLSARIVYRSKMVSLPLVTAMNATGAWERAGIELERLEYVSGAAESDPMLIGGEVDFIFGSHISPYIHMAKGVPLVCLGQTVNWCVDRLATREPVLDLSALRGKVIAESSTKTVKHPWGNHKLYLQRGGVDLSEVEWVGSDRDEARRKTFELVADGVADAAFLTPPNDTLAEDLGLVVQPLPPLPMVNATTLTTTWETRTSRPDLCRSIILAVREGIRYLKEERKAMLDLMDDEVAGALGLVDGKGIEPLYEAAVRVLDERLYPAPMSIQNAFRIAVMQEPHLLREVNPMRLWDTDLIRELDESGHQLPS